MAGACTCQEVGSSALVQFHTSCAFPAVLTHAASFRTSISTLKKRENIEERERTLKKENIEREQERQDRTQTKERKKRKNERTKERKK
jgi:hypothetical protein